ncbi:MAG: hypothetical protein WCR67_07835, partial [Bacilli bacterium]
KAKKIDFDYNSTPLGGGIVTLAYFTGAFINTFLITTVILSVGLVALSLMGTTYLSAVSVLSLYGVNALGCASATIMMMIIVSFFKKPSALGAFSGIVSAVVGFIIGAYIPLGSFSTGVQSILSIVPGSHIACLYRNILMSGVLENINMSINGVDGGVFVSGLKELFAVNLNFASWNLAALVNILYVSISSVIFLITTILLYRLSNKR